MMDAEDFNALPREEFPPTPDDEQGDGTARLGPRFAPYQDPGSESRPKFLVPDECDIKVLAEALWAAIAKVNVPPALFNSSGLAWIERDVRGQPFVRHLDRARLAHFLTRRLCFYSVDGAGREHPARPPLLDDLLVTPEPPVPVLTRIVHTPIMTPAGTIHDTPGWDATSRAFYAPAEGLTVPPIPRTPTAEDITVARALIGEVFCDFPFVSEADRTLLIAALLGVFARDLIDGPTPLTLLTKPSPGTGATLAVNAISAIALAGQPEVMTLPGDADEIRKKITSVLRSAPAITVLDNLRGLVDSGDLSAALTAHIWTDRLLGKNEELRLPVRTVWLGTSNNAVLTTELARRTVRVALDAAVERPWLRGRDGTAAFVHPDLLVWIASRRGDLIHACLTLVTAWIADGRPAGGETLGMYESWAATMGGILRTAGISGFLANLDEAYETEDMESTDLRRLLARWWQDFGDAVKRPAELLALAQDPDVSVPITGKDDAARRISFGRYLQKHKNRVVDLFPDISVRLTKMPGDRAAWRLVANQKHMGKGESAVVAVVPVVSCPTRERKEGNEVGSNGRGPTPATTTTTAEQENAWTI